ncbi:MAG TPA: AbrB/MazE/SpoVT family DNA-binding domain-containing protein [Thermodesulfovibrionales bacterium]|nr:AbrB/MazE/SpoVT family DNA-binding domain-containing protein [Thermodesulfovibrionales bacterium]
MSAIVTTSAKGQVVIPKKERERAGIKPGAKVLVETVEDHVEIRPLPDDPIEYFCGIFSKGTSLTEALLKGRKEDLKREEKKAARFVRPSGIPQGRKRTRES